MIILEIDKNDIMKKITIAMMLILSGSVFSQVSVGTASQETNKWTFG